MKITLRADRGKGTETVIAVIENQYGVYVLKDGKKSKTDYIDAADMVVEEVAELLAEFVALEAEIVDD